MIKKRGEYKAHGFKSSVQGYFELQSKDSIETIFKESTGSMKELKNFELVKSQKQWDMVNAMKHGNTIKFRTVTYEGVHAIGHTVDLKGFSKAFNQFKKTCDSFKKKEIKQKKNVVKSTEPKDWLISKNCNYISNVFILDEIEHLKPTISNEAYLHAVSCF
ncbi:invasion associated locus B family protein [Aliivibrio salmonicida]|uniref:invasion associated locus B family protein n=1 Tax=Aliivibrio salmonicida TaxID=40269 RepID=UPI00406D36CD